MQLPTAMDKGDLCRFLLESDRRLVQAFLRDYSLATAGSDRIAEIGSDPAELVGGGIAVESTTIDAQREPPRTGPCTRQCVVEAMEMFDKLEQTAEL